jgi:hypothetical protein
VSVTTRIEQARAGDLLPSYIRTIVPVVVGAALSWAIRHGLPADWLDQGEVTAWLTPLVIGAYYAAVRWLERRIPAAGWLLGLAKQPGYSEHSAPPAQPAPVDLSTVLSTSQSAANTSNSLAGYHSVQIHAPRAQEAAVEPGPGPAETEPGPRKPLDRRIIAEMQGKTLTRRQADTIIRAVNARVRT